MRRAFAHEAEIELEPSSDDGAPGAAITAALCGHWEHQGPCPLAPHHTSTARSEDRLRLRILFVAEPDREAEVRQLLVRALTAARLVRPDGGIAAWTLLSSRPVDVLATERDHAERLARN